MGIQDRNYFTLSLCQKLSKFILKPLLLFIARRDEDGLWSSFSLLESKLFSQMCIFERMTPRYDQLSPYSWLQRIFDLSRDKSFDYWEERVCDAIQGEVCDAETQRQEQEQRQRQRQIHTHTDNGTGGFIIERAESVTQFLEKALTQWHKDKGKEKDKDKDTQTQWYHWIQYWQEECVIQFCDNYATPLWQPTTYHDQLDFIPFMPVSLCFGRFYWLWWWRSIKSNGVVST